LFSTQRNDFRLKSITKDDLDELRIWKNENRMSFFFKEIISSEDQQKWFSNFVNREHDYMFVCLLSNKKIGCIGFRKLDDRVDFYNIILGDSTVSKKGYMSFGLKLAVCEAQKRYPGLPVMVSVLKTNSAMGWYLKNGFEQTAELIEHCDLQLNEKNYCEGFTSQMEE
jgi:hypothetical protein